jgi:hypothetical protein
MENEMTHAMRLSIDLTASSRFQTVFAWSDEFVRCFVGSGRVGHADRPERTPRGIVSIRRAGQFLPDTRNTGGL